MLQECKFYNELFGNEKERRVEKIILKWRKRAILDE